MNRALILDAFVQDVRYGLRTLRRQKGWTIVDILALAIGIGANTAVFSVVDTLLLRPLDYPHADRLAVVYQQPTNAQVSGVNVYMLPAASVFRAWHAGTHAFEDLEAFTTADALLRVAGEQPTPVHTAAVPPGFARFAGQRPLIGRYFTTVDIRSARKSPS